MHDRSDAIQGLVDASVDVMPVEGFRGSGKNRYFGDTDGPSAFVALCVRYQHRVIHSGFFFDTGEHLGGVGQLRYPLRADETGCLDGAKTASAEAIDQRDLVARRDQRLLVLQPIARADFDQADFRLTHAQAPACVGAVRILPG